jgi:signal transduction histidine kinase
MYLPPGFPMHLARPEPPEPLAPATARSRLVVPAIALICLSSLLIAVFAFDFVLVLPGTPTVGFESVTPEMRAWMHPLLLGICVFGMVANVFTLVAAIQMLRVRAWGLALAGCIVVALPIVSSALCLVTLPFSVWAMVVLLKPEVRAAFRKEGRK